MTELTEMPREEFERAKNKGIDFIQLSRVESIVTRDQSYMLIGEDAVIVESFLQEGKLAYPEFASAGILISSDAHKRILRKIERLKIYDLSDMD